VTLVVRGPALPMSLSANLVEQIAERRNIDEGFFLTRRDLTDRANTCDWWCLPRDPLPLETSTPGIFAVGDVRFGSTKRVDTAVGEGAMAVRLVHQYLDRIVADDSTPIEQIRAAAGVADSFPDRLELVTELERPRHERKPSLCDSGRATRLLGRSLATTCSHLGEIRQVLPSTVDGCENCLKIGDTYVHLRLCLTCGHVRCCDNSKNRHATAHFHALGHPIVRSFEPDEDWRCATWTRSCSPHRLNRWQSAERARYRQSSSRHPVPNEH